MFMQSFLRLPEKQNGSQLSLFFLFFPPLFRNNGEIGAKMYFTDLRTANTIHFFVAIKGNLSGYSFIEQVGAKRNFKRDFLINVVICLSAYH